jgi:hypothetical protein
MAWLSRLRQLGFAAAIGMAGKVTILTSLSCLTFQAMNSQV